MTDRNPKAMNETGGAWGPLERAWREDPAFRDRLAADPAAALAETGLELPAGVDRISVVEDTADTFHVIFPPSPNAPLGDEALGAVSGGVCYPGYYEYRNGCRWS